MVEEIRKSLLFSKRGVVSIVLLLLVFPPAFRGEFLKVQKLQLILFLFVGGILLFLYVKQGRQQVLRVLFLLFVLFSALYAGVGFFRGFPTYTIFKELMFFVMPLCLYVVFMKADSFKGWVQILILFAVVAALIQLMILIIFLLAGGWVDRNSFRWEFVCLTYPVMLPALWIVTGGNFLSGIRKWGAAAILILGMFATFSRGDALGMLALLAFFVGGFYRSSGRMRLWLIMLSIVPFLYFAVLNSGTHFSGSKQTDWRSYEVQRYMSVSGPDNVSFWVGNGFGWKLPISRALHVHSSDTLTEINKFHDFWLYLLSKTGVAGAFVFWGILLCFLFYINRRLFDDSSGNLSRFMLGYLAFLCFVAWNYHGGPSMAFQQSVLFALALSLTRVNTDSVVLSKGNFP